MSQITISNGQISIRFIQYVEGETDVVIERGRFIDSYVLTSEEAKEKCRFHMAENGFKVININGVAVKDGKIVDNTEKKAASPEKPQKKQTKRFIFCKESKKIWKEEYDRKKAEMLSEIRPFFKDKDYPQRRAAMESSLKDYMKSWEASKADEVNEELQKKFAERNAQ